MDGRCAIGVLTAACIGCAAPSMENADEGSSSEETASTSGTSTGGDTTSVDAESSGEDTAPLVQCPDGDATARWFVTSPEPPPETEAGEDEVMATCTIAAPAVETGGEWTLGLACDEVDGALAQPYTITVEAAESPFPALVEDESLELHHARWWGFEVGSGARLSLVQGGETRLLAINESAEGGVVGHCARVDDTFRAEANRWLEPIAARVEPAGCEPESQFRIVRTFDGGDTYAYPGAVTALGDLQAAVEDARCVVQENSGAEGWALRFVIWAD